MTRWLDGVVLIIVSLAVRLAWVHWDVWVGGDATEYFQLAHSLFANGVFGYDGHTPSTYRPPLYPALIALTLRFNSESLLYILQAVLGSATVAAVYGIAESQFGRRTALIAGAMLAVAPMTSRYVALALTETLFTFLIVFAMAAWMRGHGRWCGAALGFGVLTRTMLLPYVALVGLFGFMPKGRFRLPLGRHIAATSLLVIAPWVMRNAVVTGHVAVADAAWGDNLLYGSVVILPGSNGLSQVAREFGGFPGGPGNQAKTARLALQRIRSCPGMWLLARLTQYPRLFIDTGDYVPVKANAISAQDAWVARRPSVLVLKATFALGNVLLLAFAIAGLWSIRGRWSEFVPLWSFPVFLAAAHLPMHVEARYGLPAMPFLFIWAAFFLDRTSTVAGVERHLIVGRATINGVV